MKTQFQIVLYSSEEGFAVQAPTLPGCWSQGATKEEAIENIGIAIREYLGSEDEPATTGCVPPTTPIVGLDAATAYEIGQIEVAD
jgi:predicted RNase H-like HicB family nuclease